MIFDSIPIMTTIDGLILAIVFCGFGYAFYRRSEIQFGSAVVGSIMVGLGLLTIGGFYIYDLIVMHVFPIFMPMNEVMGHMRHLHLNLSWIVNLIAIGLIVFGFMALVVRLMIINTKLKFSEGRFRDFAQTNADRFWETDDKFNLTFVSDVPEDSTIPDSAEIIGRPIWEYKPHATEKRVRQGLNRLMKSQQPIRKYNYNRRLEKGGELHLEINANPFFDESGKFRGYRGTFADVSELIHRESQLRQAQKMEAVGQLTSGVAHDFNNILAGLMGSIELVKDDVPAASRSGKRLNQAMACVKRGAALTRRLLAFSRQQSLHPQAIDVVSLFVDIEELLARTLGEQINIVTDFSEGDWKVLTDASQLESALLNLSINARDAMPKGGNLTISTREISVLDDGGKLSGDLSPGDYVVIEVTDTGTGISTENLEKVFDPFFTTKDFGQGSGLGLSMVHGFVNQSGGHIDIESTVDIGTTISLYIPRAKPSDKKHSIERAYTTGFPKGNGERVMIVEDDPDLREITIASLERLGYEIIDAGDGNNIEDVFRKQTNGIDLLLSDIVLPNGYVGPEIAKIVTQYYPTISILFMTGYADQEINKSTSDHQKYPVLNKPFSSAELAVQVRDALASKSA